MNFLSSFIFIWWKKMFSRYIISFSNISILFIGIPEPQGKQNVIIQNGSVSIDHSVSIGENIHFDEACKHMEVKTSCGALSYCNRVLHKETASCTLLCNCQYTVWFHLIWTISSAAIVGIGAFCFWCLCGGCWLYSTVSTNVSNFYKFIICFWLTMHVNYTN